jgi:hypothetical protein
MNGNRFDRIAKALVWRTSRRRVIKGVGAVSLGGAVGVRSQASRAIAQEPSTPTASAPLVVSIPLQNYWQETITRDEALKRLEGRNLDPERRAAIAKEIPDETKHYLTFVESGFREYVDRGDGIAKLLLLLPLEKKGDKWVVIVPIHNSERHEDGRIRLISGIELHEFEVVGGKLVENGKARETFRYSAGPINLPVDAEFIIADHPGGNWCCDACEWVHSALDIHCADWFCCIGTCPTRPSTSIE